MLRDIVGDANVPSRSSNASLFHPDYLAVLEAGDSRSSAGDDIVILVDRKLHSSRRSRGKHASGAKNKGTTGGSTLKTEMDAVRRTTKPEPAVSHRTPYSDGFEAPKFAKAKFKP